MSAAARLEAEGYRGLSNDLKNRRSIYGRKPTGKHIVMSNGFLALGALLSFAGTVD